MQASLLGAEASAASDHGETGAAHPALVPGPDALGSGALGEPRAVQVGGEMAGPEMALATLEDRGVRGAVLRCGDLELPLAFADIRCEGSMVTVTVHEAVHPGCALKGQAIGFTCASPVEAKSWIREMELAVRFCVPFAVVLRGFPFALG